MTEDGYYGWTPPDRAAPATPDLATEAQKKAIRKWGGKTPRGMTKREASDWLDWKIKTATDPEWR